MGEMIENIAHQWRQPLSQINSILLVVDDRLEELGVKDHLVQEKFEDIERLTAYMSKTITDFREFYTTGKEKNEFLVNNAIEDALNIVKASLSSHEIAVEFIVEDEYECFNYENELKQVILVLLNNAKDAINMNETLNPKIILQIKKEKKEIKISVCDNAGGIPLEIFDKIFEPYFTTKDSSKGTGLGLYISKRIIEESLGGRLWAENRENGVCFYCSIDGMEHI